MYCDDLRGVDSQLPGVFLIAEELVIELRDVALFQVFEAEVGAEEARGAVLQGDALLAADVRTPQPLIAGAVGVIDDQQADAFHFGGHGEPQHAFAVAEGADAVEHPAFRGDAAAAADHFQRAFVVLRLGALAALDFFHDLTRVLRGSERRCQQEAGEESYSYSRASTSEPRTALSAGPSAARNAAPRITGANARAVANRVGVTDVDAHQIAPRNLDGVVKFDGSEQQAQRESDESDGGRLHPYGVADLLAQSADGLQHAELAPAVGDRNRKGVHDAQHRDQYGHGDLHVGESEPLIGQACNVIAHVFIGEHEQPLLFSEGVEDALADFRGVRAGREI